MLYRDLAAVIEKVTCTLHPKKIKIHIFCTQLLMHPVKQWNLAQQS